MSYKFYGAENTHKAVFTPVPKYEKISDPCTLYDMLSRIWCAETCAPRMRNKWTPENKTLGQCSITAFLTQDIFGGEVRGILREGGNYHCYNIVGDCVFDLTSEQFGDEKLCYDDAPVQTREAHFSKEEKRLRYEYLKSELEKLHEKANLFTVLEITEHDYGCEGVPENGELMCRVLARDNEGGEHEFTLSDSFLKARGIREGGAVTLF